MDVSINYPWGSHRLADGRCVSSPGWDFGTAPASWGLPDPAPRSSARWPGGCRPPRIPYWRRHLADDLRALHGCGIQAVRFAILFNGLTYGTGADAPRLVSGGKWDFVPGPLSPEFLADFRVLVRTFADYADGDGVPYVRLMPVLFGFDFAADPRAGRGVYRDFVDGCGVHYVAGGRAAALGRDPMPGAATSGDQRTRQQAFLDHVVDGLLAEFDAHGALAGCQAAIHSIDLCGEPESLTAAPNTATSPARPVAHADTIALLTDGVQRIHRRGFRATIGFRLLDTSTHAEWTVPLHLGQFHYYDGERLPVVHGDDPAIIGEAATASTSPFDPRIVAQMAGRTRASGPAIPLALRLEWFERLRYQEVFLWSAGRAPADDRHSWSQVEAEQIRRFVYGERPHRAIIDAACVAAFGATTP